jgi:hypothetical protein
MLSRLLNSAASGFDVAIVRIAQELARRAAGPGPNTMERLARLQSSARAYAGVDPSAFYAVPRPLDGVREAVEHEALRGKLIPPWLAEAGKRALTLVRPLARGPVIPGDRMLIAAAEADRITLSATHARKLAQHFRAPLVTFNGAHLIQIGRRTAFAEMARLLARRGAISGR